MSAAAPTVSFPSQTPSRPSPGRLRSLFGGSASFRRVLLDQATVLREAAQSVRPDHHRRAVDNHRFAVSDLRHALITPFDSEDIVELLLRMAQTVNCLRQVSEHAQPRLDDVAREWALVLTPAIPVLPKSAPVDEALEAIAALDRRYRQGLRESFLLVGDNPIELVRLSTVRERYQALHASLRGLTFQTRRIRYRNG